jgi:Tol biopolymer transport system component
MPDAQEVFRLSTQKVRPDPGFLERQEFRQQRTVRNRKIGAYVVVAAMVAVGGLAIVSQQDGGEGQQPAGTTDATVAPDPSVTTHMYFDIATGQNSPVPIPLGGAALMEVSPNGETVAYSTCCDGDDQVFVSSLDGSATDDITPEGLDAYAPTWIDDERILFQVRPGQTERLGDLYVANLTTGKVTRVVALPDEWDGAWIVISDVSPDGTTVLYHLPRGKGEDVTWDLWTVPLAGGEPTLLRKNAGYAQYSADGSIVYLDHPVPFEGEAIWTMDGDGSNARRLVEHRGDGIFWPRVSPDGTKVAYSLDLGVEWVDIESGAVTATGQLTEYPTWYGNDKLIV